MNNIYLFQQFYISNNKLRYNETKYCLMKNYNNKYISKIYLLNEKIYTNKELGISDNTNVLNINNLHNNTKNTDLSNNLNITKNLENNKIIQVNINKRLMFKDVIDYVKNNNIEGYIIISNSDIYYNETLLNIYRFNLKNKRAALCQLRIELKTNLFKIKPYASTSQDTWIYHTNNKINTDKYFISYLGVSSCDGYMTYCLRKENFKLYNFPNLIKCFHVHREAGRDSPLRNTKIKNFDYRLKGKVQPIYFHSKENINKAKKLRNKIVNKIKYKS